MYTIRHSLSGRAIARVFKNAVQAQIHAIELNKNQRWYEIGEWVVTPAYSEELPPVIKYVGAITGRGSV